jgi:hypothetical protein
MRVKIHVLYRERGETGKKGGNYEREVTVEGWGIVREGNLKETRRERKEEDVENGSVWEQGQENNRTGSQGQERRAGEKGQESRTWEQNRGAEQESRIKGEYDSSEGQERRQESREQKRRTGEKSRRERTGEQDMRAE